MPYQIPTFSPPKKRQRPKQKKKSLAEAVGLKTTKAPSKQARPPTSSSQTPKDDSKRQQSPASSLAQAAMAMPGRGKIGRVVKGALAGAAAGAELQGAYKRYKAGRAKKRAKKAKITVSQSAMAQKAQYHKKDPTKTKRV